MSQHPETMKVKPWSNDQGDFVLINKEDFDPKKHEEFKEPKGSKSKVKVEDSDTEEGLASKTVKEIKEYAKKHKIDLAGKTKKADMLKIIDEFEAEKKDDEPFKPNFASDEAGEVAVGLNSQGRLSTEELAQIEGTGEDGALTVGDIEDFVAAKEAE